MIKKFTLGAREYNIEYIDSIDDTGLGRCYHATGIIKLSKKWQGFNLPEDSIEQTFYHELTHAILSEMGEEELSSNERFVQGFSMLLHQFQISKK